MMKKDRAQQQAEEIYRLRQNGLRSPARPMGLMDVSSDVAGVTKVIGDPNLQEVWITFWACQGGPVRHKHLLKKDTGALGCLVPECQTQAVPCRVYVTVVKEKRNG